MFFVLEGIDGAGCGTQRKNIEKKLKLVGFKVTTLKFPHYGNEIGKMIHQFLKKGVDLSLEMQFLLFASQMVAEKEKINSLRKTQIVISDHYFPATLVYQGVNGFNYQKGLRFAKDFQLETPDAIFFLDTPSEVAKQRKLKEEGKEQLDRYEADFQFSKEIDKEYRRLIADNVFGKWEAIDNTKTIDEVTDDIVNRMNKYLKIKNLKK